MFKNRLSIDILLFGFLLTLTSSFGQTFFIALFSQPLRESLSLSNFEFSAVYSAATLLSAATLSWTALSIDKLPLEKVTVLSLFGLLIGTLAFSFAEFHVVILFTALFCLRQFGQGMLALLSATSMSRGFQRARGRALSVSALGHAFGEALFPSIAVALLVTLGLRQTWLVISIGLIIMTFLIVFISYCITAKQSDSKILNTQQKDFGKQWSRREVLHDRYFWALLPMLVTAPFVITGLFFHQVVIAQNKQWSIALFAASFGIYALTQVAGSLLTGLLIDRRNAREILRYTLIPLLLACQVLAISESKIALWVFMGLCGLSTGAMFPSTMAALTEVYGIRNIASIKSVVASALIFSTAISPPILGWFLDHNTSIEMISIGLSLGIFATLVIGNISLFRINQRYIADTAPESSTV